MKYKRILLKLSGEALSGKTPIDFEHVLTAAGHIKALHDISCQLGVVVGGGNIWRGRSGGTMDRSRADNIGMLATAMNALALEQALIDLGVPVRAMSAVSMEVFMDSYSAREANKSVDEGTVVIFACGSGSPFFSTDTAAALRAAQIHADALLLAKNIDGIYTADPNIDTNAKRYVRISFDEVIARNLKATDLTAMSFCREYGLPMVVFEMRSDESFVMAANGVNAGTIVDNEPGFELA
ncbi:MAG: UMP kinase [Christensenellaceae bacterium]|nr:UMP kinase [Christensenellaceae bacterium]